MELRPATREEFDAFSRAAMSAFHREYTETDRTFHFELRGEYHFKGVLGEHVVYAVDWSDGDGEGA